MGMIVLNSGNDPTSGFYRRLYIQPSQVSLRHENVWSWFDAKFKYQ